MKRFSFYAICGLSLLFAACSSAPENGAGNALLKELTDSTMVAEFEGNTLTLSIDGTNFNDPVQEGDSIELRFAAGKAVYVRLLPRANRVVDLDELRNSGAELKTRQADSADVAVARELSEKAQKK